MMPEELLGMPEEGMLPGEGPEMLGAEEPVAEKPKDKPKDKEAEKELLESMLFSPSAGDADSTLEIEESSEVEDDEDIDAKDLIKILEQGDGTLAEKYKTELLEKALKDPDSIEVETPEGWMTVKEAIEKGFDLTTNDFTNDPIPPVDWDGEISKLDPREQDTIRRLTQADTPQAGPAEMIGEPEIDPAMMAEGLDPMMGEPDTAMMEEGLEGGV